MLQNAASEINQWQKSYLSRLSVSGVVIFPFLKELKSEEEENIDEGELSHKVDTAWLLQ